MESFQVTGPHVRFPPKFFWIKSFYKNFEGWENVPSFIPKDNIVKIPIGLESYNIPIRILCKGA
uniref:Uncharacterized protein n=1 Tax=Setaria italica TaxID=4555 RepID=K3Y172_SETIT